jgi:hypothetical protein
MFAHGLRGDTTMTLEHLVVEAVILQQPQENQKKHWLRLGLAGDLAAAGLFAAVAFRVVFTGDAPSLPMIVIALVLSVVAVTFSTIGRLLAQPRSR